VSAEHAERRCQREGVHARANCRSPVPTPSHAPAPTPARSETLYNLGKVLIFMTHITPNPASVGKRLDSSKAAAREAVVLSVQGILAHIVATPDILVALGTLVAPALAAVGDRSEGDVNRVDLFLTLIKQLLECPAPSSVGATAAVASMRRFGQRERFILALSECKILSILTDLCALTERREFSRLSCVLMDVWYQLLKTESPQSLHDAARAAAHAEVEAAAARASALAAAAKAAAEASKAAGSRLGFQSPYRRKAEPVHVPVVQPLRNLAASQRLGELLAAEQVARAPIMRAALNDRHSRFGSAFTHERQDKENKGRITSSARSDVLGEGERDTAQRAGKRRGPVVRKADMEVYAPPAVIDVAEARGTGDRAGVSAALVRSVRVALHIAALGFLARETLVLRVSKRAGKAEEEAPQEKEEGGEEESKEAGAAPSAEGKEEAGEEEEEEEVTLSAFATLTAAVKDRIVRDNDEVSASDRLKYLHTTALLLGLHRATALAAVNAAQDASKAAAKAGDKVRAAALATSAPYDATPVMNCLDSWSFRNVIAVCDDYASRKAWAALCVAGAHLAQLVQTVHTMREHGDEETRDIGEQVYDAMFRDREVSEALPRIFRTWEAGRYHADFLPSLVEATHYMLKLADKADESGMKTAGGRSSDKGSAGRKARADADSDEDEGAARRRAAIEANEMVERRQRAAAAKKERTFEAARYVSDFVHPAILSAYTALLGRYASNAAKTNFFAVSFLRRLARLPNEYAGLHPVTGQQLTYAVATYQVSLLGLAAKILSDPRAASSRSCADALTWAGETAAGFGAQLRTNPLLAVEALFWRPGKEANADVAKHYGVLDGSAGMPADGEGGAEVAGMMAALGGKGRKRKSKAAKEADEAEAEARRMARAAKEQAGSDGEGAEAEVDFDAEEDFAMHPRARAGKGKAAGGKGKMKARRALAGSDSDSSSASSSSSSGSSSSSDDSSDSGAEKAPAALVRTQPKARQAKLVAVTAQAEVDKAMEALEEEDAAAFDADLAVAQAARAPAADAAGGPAPKRARKTVIDDSDEEEATQPAAGAGATYAATQGVLVDPDE